MPVPVDYPVPHHFDPNDPKAAAIGQPMIVGHLEGFGRSALDLHHAAGPAAHHDHLVGRVVGLAVAPAGLVDLGCVRGKFDLATVADGGSSHPAHSTFVALGFDPVGFVDLYWLANSPSFAATETTFVAQHHENLFGLIPGYGRAYLANLVGEALAMDHRVAGLAQYPHYVVLVQPAPA